MQYIFLSFVAFFIEFEFLKNLQARIFTDAGSMSDKYFHEMSFIASKCIL